MKIENKEKYTIIKADEGMVLTDWDGKDIMEYTSSISIYCPLTIDTSRYYEISTEQDAIYLEEQERELMEREERGY